MREPDDKLSRSEEQKFLELGRRVFTEHSPNPTRTGCPSKDTLRAMAFRSKQLAAADLPLQHLTICSPCFQDYTRFRRQAVNQTIFKSALAAANTAYDTFNKASKQAVDMAESNFNAATAATMKAANDVAKPKARKAA